MIYLRIFLVFILGLSVAWSQDLPPGSPRIEVPNSTLFKDAVAPVKTNFIRVATWNIEWFPAGLRKSGKEFVNRQMEAVSQMIQEIHPDILCTQETRNMGALIVLNRMFKIPFFSGVASARYDEENQARLDEYKPTQNTGLLSRYPWKEIWEVDFGALTYPDRPTRGWLGVRFNISDLDFVIYNGHTKSNFGEENEKDRKRNYTKRLNSIKELKKDWDRLNLDPNKDKILVVGDFNTDIFGDSFKDEPTLKLLQSWGFKHCFGDLPLQQRTTLPAREGEPYPDGTFDYIWFSSAWGEQIPQAQILSKGASKRKDVAGGDEPGLSSDHYPVFVDIPLNETKAEEPPSDPKPESDQETKSESDSGK